MSHTPEPWISTVYGSVRVKKNGEEVILFEHLHGREGRADADRVVACVNGCAGLNPAAYRELVKAGDEVLSCNALWDEIEHERFNHQEWPVPVELLRKLKHVLAHAHQGGGR